VALPDPVERALLGCLGDVIRCTVPLGGDLPADDDPKGGTLCLVIFFCVCVVFWCMRLSVICYLVRGTCCSSAFVCVFLCLCIWVSE
jgi:hypothetical protein